MNYKETNMQTIEQIYQRHIAPIPIKEQLRLVDFITQTLTKQDDNKASWVKVSNNNWRDNMSEKVKILVSEEELIQPITDIWEDYI
jgi:hypothetical protein